MDKYNDYDNNRNNYDEHGYDNRDYESRDYENRDYDSRDYDSRDYENRDYDSSNYDNGGYDGNNYDNGSYDNHNYENDYESRDNRRSYDEEYYESDEYDYNKPQDDDMEFVGRSRRKGDSPNSRAKGSKTGSGSGKSSGRNSSNASDAKRKKMTTILILVVAELITLIGIFVYAYIIKQYNKIQRPNVDLDAVMNENLSLEDIRQMETGYWNIAVFGVDSRNSSVGKGNNSDVIIIVSINRETGDIKLLSVYRDTYLKIGDNSYNKINAAYCNGGPEAALIALNDNLDLNITQYATFNWKAVATGINILGGVDVDLSKAEFKYINSFITETVKGTGIGSVQLKSAGPNHLDGVQAVAYARLRLMDNDYARTERQRKIIKLCFEKAKHADLQTLNDLLGNMLSMIATNLTWQDGIDAIANINKYNIADSAGFPFARGEASMGKKGACVIPQTLESNVIELHSYLFGDTEYVPSDAVKTISARISADTGMYKEGKKAGPVSTEGYLPKETVPAETKEGTQEKPEEEKPKESVLDKSKNSKIEYAISADGYLICVDGYDSNGNKKYKYVLDDNDKRIKMVEFDERGNMRYLYETDADGNYYLNGRNITGEKTTEETRVLETDENGNILPGQGDDDSNMGPGWNTTPTSATSSDKPTRATQPEVGPGIVEDDNRSPGGPTGDYPGGQTGNGDDMAETLPESTEGDEQGIVIPGGEAGPGSFN